MESKVIGILEVMSSTPVGVLEVYFPLSILFSFLFLLCILIVTLKKNKKKKSDIEWNNLLL